MSTRNSNLRPNQRRYRMSDHGSTFDEGNRIGAHVIKRSSNCDYWKPSWNGTETVIRIFPALNPDNPSEWDPFRISTKHLDFGDWVRTYPAVRNFGNPSITMLLADPSADEAYDINTNPCMILYRTIETACKNGQGKPEWYPLREFVHGRGKALSKPTKLGLVQCALYKHNNKNYCDGDRPPRGSAIEDRTVVFELPLTALKSFFELLEERDEDWKGDDLDWNQYTYGDIVSLDSGAFVHFYERGHDPRAKQVVKKSAFGGSRAKASDDDDDRTKGFDCFIDREFLGMRSDISGQEDIVREKHKPWDDVVQIYSHDQQAHLLNGCFPPSVILAAFRDHPEWIDSTTKRMATSTKTVDMRQNTSFDDEDDNFAEPVTTGRDVTPSVGNKPRVRQDNVVPDFDMEYDANDANSAVLDDDNFGNESQKMDEFDAVPEQPNPPKDSMDSLNAARMRANSRRRTNG